MPARFLLHLHPPSIKTHALRPSFTWCMGGITSFLFLVELLTGVLLMFYYRPTIEWAYHDMLDLRDVVSFGVLREVHRWAGHAMVITVMLHMYRVFLTGSYKSPREFNWCIGVLLLVLTFAFSFTGYLLPWDQLSLWAVTVGANLAGDARLLLLGDRTVGEETLNRFYVLHCLALPLLTVSLMSLHFWRVRKDGISGPL
jgi:quinol-cytochrome oxidoreductase complex cytochrome b subunit